MKTWSFCFKLIATLHFILLTVLGFAFFETQVEAREKEKGAFIFIPLDDRPVCYSYPVKVMEAAGYKILTPPEKL